MLNIIIGKNSNLSQILQESIENSLLISSQNSIEELNKIDFNLISKINIIFNNLKINKIIICSENDPILPLNLHASLKVANGRSIEKFSIDTKINYTIARVFNTYGGDNNFSIISKIINRYKFKNVACFVQESIKDRYHG